ncbi:MAG: 3-deoxy-manno-octulosonate cytidylyltransferase [Halieaceae bacterium]|nr:3-deoxy-manno-octulosonate cytidylyltransferase [Halieaceae bacterium]
MTFSVVIPARHDSSRLPGKVLADICGKSMLQRVYEQACASAASRVVIATDDVRISAVAEAFGAKVCMTLAGHPSGTDRVEEVTRQLTFDDTHIVVNVQGDEPLIPPQVIDQVADNLATNTSADIATLSTTITGVEELFDSNVVKVVADNNDLALYFSRAPIPWERDAFDAKSRADRQTSGTARRHLGIYAYRVGLLHRFVAWPAQLLEQLEALEQLRALANGARIHVEQACCPVPAGVDTAEDLDRVRRSIALNSEL